MSYIEKFQQQNPCLELESDFWERYAEWLEENLEESQSEVGMSAIIIKKFEEENKALHDDLELKINRSVDLNRENTKLKQALEGLLKELDPDEEGNGDTFLRAEQFAKRVLTQD